MPLSNTNLQNIEHNISVDIIKEKDALVLGQQIVFNQSKNAKITLVSLQTNQIIGKES